ncbi:MAG: ATP-binding protein [Candidatus Altiarchaeota archaeon]
MVQVIAEGISMIISIASGKGGTGKTTLAVNLALSMGDVHLVDCDVEEPNCHIFLKPETFEARDVCVKVPDINHDLCDYCGKCSEFCQYNALAVANRTMLEFPELCHSCGGCSIVCPKNAISEREMRIGEVRSCKIGGLDFSYGILDIGKAMASPIIRSLKSAIDHNRDVILDSPPGTSCAVIESVKGSDYCVLVTESTPFGLNDMKLAIEMLESIGVPYGVAINRYGLGDSSVDDYCSERDIPVLVRLPYDRRIAELYSKGVPFISELSKYSVIFNGMIDSIREVVG